MAKINTSLCWGILSFLFVVIINTGCAKKTTTLTEEPSLSLHDIIYEHMGGKITKTYNQTGDYILCIKEISSLLSSFMVISKEGHIAMEKRNVKGTVTWHDNYSIIITTLPGVVDKRSDQAQTKETIIAITTETI